MPAIWMRVRAEFRGRWRAWLVLASVIGLFGGAILAAAAGARRTASAYDRFLVTQRAYDAATFYAAFDPAFAELRPDEVEALPAVAEFGRGNYFETDEGAGALDGAIDAMAPEDDRWGRTFNVMKVLEGRRPDPRAVDEAAVPISIAQALGARVGGAITIPFQRMGPRGPELAPIELRVTGITIAPGEFPPDLANDPPFVHLTPAFHERYASSLAGFGVGFFRLKGGVDGLGRFREGIEGLARGKVFFILDQPSRTSVANAATKMIATAIWLLAAGLIVIAVLTVGQALARQTFLESDDLPTARALGMTSRGLFAVGILRALIVGVLSAAISVAIAIAVSPLTPFGIARWVEPHPGIAVDALAHGLGALAIVIGVVLLAAYPSWRAERAIAARTGGPQRRSRLASVAWRAGLPATVVTGIRLALERGRGRTAVPVRASLAGAVLGVGALVMAFTFGASLEHVLRSSELYGVTWDAEVGVRLANDRDRAAAPDLARRLDASPIVDHAGVADSGIPFTVDGRPAAGIAIAPHDVSISPPLISGAHPDTAEKIALGPKTLDAIGKEIGDTVDVRVSGLQEPRIFTIVGIAAMPGFDTSSPLGVGAVVTDSAVARFLEDPPVAETVFVRFVDGVGFNEGVAALREVPGVTTVERAIVPADLVNLRRVRDLPALMAGLLAFLAAATIGHALISIVRRRRRDLAILMSLGFVRGQVRASVAAQAATLAAVALVIGIPAGMIVGRWLWAGVASAIGLISDPRTPPVAVWLMVPAAVVLAVVISALPGRAAARTRPATVLKAE